MGVRGDGAWTGPPWRRGDGPGLCPGPVGTTRGKRGVLGTRGTGPGGGCMAEHQQAGGEVGRETHPGQVGMGSDVRRGAGPGCGALSIREWRRGDGGQGHVPQAGRSGLHDAGGA
ncbi:MAG: hypothetical protein WDW38_010490 [Sanguina aurantia]